VAQEEEGDEGVGDRAGRESTPQEGCTLAPFSPRPAVVVVWQGRIRVAGASLEERVAYLEGKVEEHSRGYAQLREDIQQLRQQVIHLDQKIDRFREELAARIDALDQKFSRWFAWLTGILITALLAQLGLLGAALFRR